MKKFFIIGLVEILVSLVVLIQIPSLLNGKYPQLGLVLLILTPATLVGSATYSISEIIKAQSAKELFVLNFPQHINTPIDKFLGLSYNKVLNNLPALKAASGEDSTVDLTLELLEVLKNED